MQVQGPPLLPLLRSRTQAAVLTRLLLTPGDELSLTDLAEIVGASVSSVQREVARAEKAGIVSTRKVGQVRLVRASERSPLFGPLAELLLRSFGPSHVVAEEFANVKRVNKLYLFGSWAARYLGEPGAAPADIDVLVIGTPDRDEADDAARRAEGRLGRPVEITIRSPERWASKTDPFVAEIQSRPLVAVRDGTERP